MIYIKKRKYVLQNFLNLDKSTKFETVGEKMEPPLSDVSLWESTGDWA